MYFNLPQIEIHVPTPTVTGPGRDGACFVSGLERHGLPNVDFVSCNQLIKNQSPITFILFVIYSAKDICKAEVDEISHFNENKTVIEIILTGETATQNPHYIVNNLSAAEAAQEISTLIQAFINLGRCPTHACIDPTDIRYSLKNAGRLRMKEFEIESNEKNEVLNRLRFLQKTSQKIKTVWIQIYIQEKNDSHFKILENVLGALHSCLDEDVDVLWNESDEGLGKNEKSKCVLIFC